MWRLRRFDISQSPSIYVRPDLTKAQQKVDSHLRAELASIVKDLYKIYRGKIVLRNAIPVANQHNTNSVVSNINTIASHTSAVTNNSAATNALLSSFDRGASVGISDGNLSCSVCNFIPV